MTQLPAPVLEFSQYMTVVKGRQPRTVDQYEIDLMLFFKFLKAKRGGLPLEGEAFDEMTIYELDHDFASSVTRYEVMEFLSFVARNRENSARTRARKLSALKSFYKYYCGTMMRFPQNPTDHIDTPKIPKTLPKHLSADESVTLLRTVNSDEESRFKERNYCMITLFLNCGMRLSELVGLNLGDLDRELRSMRVMGKGAKERVIYLNDACRDALNTYLKVRDASQAKGDRHALFLSSRHRRISKQMVQTVVYKYLEAAGFDNRGLSVHKLRHTAATLMYQTGRVDIRVLKDILGHEQLNTTQIYTHVSNAEMERAMSHNPLADMTAKKVGKDEGEET
ncbi:MAG: tyrosine recombinase XerC [Ruminococcaceae bacterium]|nr:tyrosine recombinase XerC [Oscillospiraceae bacterium]